jgi:hypothetical protein
VEVVIGFEAITVIGTIIGDSDMKTCPTVICVGTVMTVEIVIGAGIDVTTGMRTGE